MAKQGAKTAVPRLRFPEFRAGTRWRIYELSSVADLAKGVQLSSSLKDESAKFLHFNGGITYSSRTSRANRDANTTIVSEGGNSCGYVQFVEEPFWCGGHCYSITPKRPEANRYLFYVLQAKQKDIMGLRVGSGLPNIQKNALEKFEIAYAEDSFEQQKIADCLASLDEVIAAQGRKVEALKAHKRGLMQQLFPREGETRPRLRFREFCDAPEWAAKRLEDVAPLQRGFDLTSAQIEAGDVPVVYSNGIRSYHNVGMANGPGLVTGRSGTIGNLHFIDKGNYWPHNTSLWVTTFKDHDPKFVYYLYAAIGIERFASGSGVPTLNRNDVHAFETRVPRTKGEQQRIADCLSSLDAEITAESTQLAALKTHKQGLMQQLFPASVGG